MTETYSGTDYGLGQSNVDKKTGIRYGVISQYSISLDQLDWATEPVYAGPNCPDCGNDVVEYDETTHGDYEKGREHGCCADYACESCKLYLDSDMVWGEEIIGYKSTNSDYEVDSCLDTDLFVLKSPYYTHAQFCSPCVPGAGNLDNPMPEGVKCYALGHEWFEDGKAPYPVYRIDDNSEVLPE